MREKRRRAKSRDDGADGARATANQVTCEASAGMGAPRRQAEPGVT